MAVEHMTPNEAQTLEPGQKLTWTGKDKPVQRIGATAHQMYAGPYGETVTFIRHTGENSDGWQQMPIIVVETAKGPHRFSSGWLKKA